MNFKHICICLYYCLEKNHVSMFCEKAMGVNEKKRFLPKEPGYTKQSHNFPEFHFQQVFGCEPFNSVSVLQFVLWKAKQVPPFDKYLS